MAVKHFHLIVISTAHWLGKIITYISVQNIFSSRILFVWFVSKHHFFSSVTIFNGLVGEVVSAWPILFLEAGNRSMYDIFL